MKNQLCLTIFQIYSFIVCINNFASAQSVDEIVNKFEKQSHTYQNTTLPYRFFIPENYDSTQSYPLMLCLHGAGERGSDNEVHIQVHGMATSWADTANQSERPCFVVAPQCPKNNRWVDSAWDIGTYSTEEVPVSNELQTVINLLDSLLNEFNIDLNRQYVTGLSMGGYGTWDLIARYPERFAAAIPMSGAGDTSRVDKFRNVPVWNFHGAKDGTVSVAGSREMVTAMRSSGIVVKQTDNMPDIVIAYWLTENVTHLYTEYPNGNHVIWQESYDYSRLHEWVFSQTRNTTGVFSHKTAIIEKSFRLEQNYPNPFNPSTTMSFYIPAGGHVKLEVFNTPGQLVAVLESKYLAAGNYTYNWEAPDQLSGLYYYRLTTAEFVQTRKMLLLR